MIKRAMNFGYNILFEQWLKEVMFTLHYNLKEKLHKMIYHWNTVCLQKYYLECINVLQILLEMWKDHFIMPDSLVKSQKIWGSDTYNDTKNFKD